jgi:type IV fimbrial biogenesis protein FimT
MDMTPGPVAASPSPRPHPARPAGFSLIETLTAIAVLAVILVVAAASFGNVFTGNRMFAAQSSLSSALALARSESSLRGVPVVVSASSPASGNEFGGGWTVFADLDGDGTLGAGEPELRRQDALTGGVVVKTGGPTAVTYTPSGFLSPATSVTFRFCRSVTNVDHVREYALVVQPNGMSDVDATACP